MEAWPERLQGMPDDVKEGMRELLDECKQDMEENIRSIRYETDARAKTPASRVTGALKAHDARPPRGRALTGSVRPPHPPPPHAARGFRIGHRFARSVAMRRARARQRAGLHVLRQPAGCK